jgi:hypothetical protein
VEGSTYSRRWAWTSVTILDIDTGSLLQLRKEESALKAQLLDSAPLANESDTRCVVGFFNLVEALLQLNTFSAIGLLDGGWERWWNCACAQAGF